MGEVDILYWEDLDEEQRKPFEEAQLLEEKVFEEGYKEPIFIMKRLDLYKGDYNLQFSEINKMFKSMNVAQMWINQTGVGEKFKHIGDRVPRVL